MELIKGYGVCSSSFSDAYAKNANFELTSKSQVKGKLTREYRRYESIKTHGIIWKISRAAIAIFVSFFTFGLSNVFYSFRLYWKEACSGKETYAVFILFKKIQEVKQQGLTNQPKFDFMEGVKIGSGSELIKHLKSKNPSLDVVKALHKKDANILRFTNKYGENPLHFAVTKQLELVRYLLEGGTSTTDMDLINRRTPWLQACAKGASSEVLDLFLNRLSKTELLAQGHGGNALHLAVRRNQKAVVKYLLEKEIGKEMAQQKDDCNASNRTPLDVAQHKGNIAIANLLSKIS